VGGGTGSGLGTLLLERLAIDYGQKSKIGINIYPRSKISTSVVEPYNAVLATHTLLEHVDASILFVNDALYDICIENLKIEKPTYSNLNALISKSMGLMTQSLRFEKALNSDITEFETNLVPYPRVHFISAALSSYAPPDDQNWEEALSVEEMTLRTF
jgi:tubulin alpha